MKTLWQDIRYSFRMLLRGPFFALLVISILALSIGVSSAIFSIVNGFLFEPLPYPDPDRLVMVWETNAARGIDSNVVSRANFLDWRQQSHAFESMGAYVFSYGNLVGEGEPERVPVAAASSGLFRTLRRPAALGRTFTDDEDKPGSDKVVVLSDTLWRRRFGADPAVIGRRINLDGEMVTVVGVMPLSFRFPENVELWKPLAINVAAPGNRGGHSLYVVARLNPGISVERAREEMRVIAAGLAQQYPESNKGWGANVVSLLTELTSDVRTALFTLLGAVVLVLLISCANVANLFLARATVRRREMALRMALGAGRPRLLRQLVTESLVFSLLGSLLGLGIAAMGIKALMALSPEDFPRLHEISLNGAVFIFALTVSLGTGLVFGLAPALEATRLRFSDTLREGGGQSSGGSGRRLRGFLVVSEVCVALVLLISAALLIDSFRRLYSTDPGFSAHNLLTMRISLPRQKYKEPTQQALFFQQLLQRIKTLPGIDAVTLTSYLPVSGVPGLWNNSFHLEGQEPASPRDESIASLRWVAPDYFRTLGIPLRHGRSFADTDTMSQPRVVVVDQAMVDKFLPHQDPLGKRIEIDYGEKAPTEIVGVVGNVRQTALEKPPEPHIYLPYTQSPVPGMTLIVQTSVDNPKVLADPIRRAVWELDKNQPVQDIRTMEEHLARSIAQSRFNMTLVSLFAVVALILAVAGIYGVLSYSVTQRTREIGIRVALGADRPNLLAMIIYQGMGLTAIGIGLGVLASLGATRFISSLLYQVSATDPQVFLLVPLVLVTASLLACIVPACRAMRVEPLVALRSE